MAVCKNDSCTDVLRRVIRMYYKQFLLGGQIISAYITSDNITLLKYCIYILESEYNSLKKIFSIINSTIELTHLN